MSALRVAAVFAIVFGTLFVSVPVAYAAGDVADGLCNPYIAKCGCGMVPDPKDESKCIKGANTYECPIGICFDDTSDTMSVRGICTGPNKCGGRQCNSNGTWGPCATPSGGGEKQPPTSGQPGTPAGTTPPATPNSTPSTGESGSLSSASTPQQPTTPATTPTNFSPYNSIIDAAAGGQKDFGATPAGSAPDFGVTPPANPYPTAAVGGFGGEISQLEPGTPPQTQSGSLSGSETPAPNAPTNGETGFQSPDTSGRATGFIDGAYLAKEAVGALDSIKSTVGGWVSTAEGWAANVGTAIGNDFLPPESTPSTESPSVSGAPAPAAPTEADLLDSESNRPTPSTTIPPPDAGTTLPGSPVDPNAVHQALTDAGTALTNSQDKLTQWINDNATEIQLDKDGTIRSFQIPPSQQAQYTQLLNDVNSAAKNYNAAAGDWNNLRPSDQYTYYANQDIIAQQTKHLDAQNVIDSYEGTVQSNPNAGGDQQLQLQQGAEANAAYIAMDKASAQITTDENIKAVLAQGGPQADAVAKTLIAGATDGPVTPGTPLTTNQAMAAALTTAINNNALAQVALGTPISVAPEPFSIPLDVSPGDLVPADAQTKVDVTASDVAQFSGTEPLSDANQKLINTMTTPATPWYEPGTATESPWYARLGQQTLDLASQLDQHNPGLGVINDTLLGPATAPIAATLDLSGNQTLSQQFNELGQTPGETFATKAGDVGVLALTAAPFIRPALGGLNTLASEGADFSRVALGNINGPGIFNEFGAAFEGANVSTESEIAAITSQPSFDAVLNAAGQYEIPGTSLPEAPSPSIVPQTPEEILGEAPLPINPILQEPVAAGVPVNENVPLSENGSGGNGGPPNNSGGGGGGNVLQTNLPTNAQIVDNIEQTFTNVPAEQSAGIPNVLNESGLPLAEWNTPTLVEITPGEAPSAGALVVTEPAPAAAPLETVPAQTTPATETSQPAQYAKVGDSWYELDRVTGSVTPITDPAVENALAARSDLEQVPATDATQQALLARANVQEDATLNGLDAAQQASKIQALKAAQSETELAQAASAAQKADLQQIENYQGQVYTADKLGQAQSAAKAASDAGIGQQDVIAKVGQDYYNVSADGNVQKIVDPTVLDAIAARNFSEVPATQAIKDALDASAYSGLAADAARTQAAIADVQASTGNILIGGNEGALQQAVRSGGAPDSQYAGVVDYSKLPLSEAHPIPTEAEIKGAMTDVYKINPDNSLIPITNPQVADAVRASDNATLSTGQALDTAAADAAQSLQTTQLAMVDNYQSKIVSADSVSQAESAVKAAADAGIGPTQAIAQVGEDFYSVSPTLGAQQITDSAVIDAIQNSGFDSISATQVAKDALDAATYSGLATDAARVQNAIADVQASTGDILVGGDQDILQQAARSGGAPGSEYAGVVDYSKLPQNPTAADIKNAITDAYKINPDNSLTPITQPQVADAVRASDNATLSAGQALDTAAANAAARETELALARIGNYDGRIIVADNLGELQQAALAERGIVQPQQTPSFGSGSSPSAPAVSGGGLAGAETALAELDLPIADWAPVAQLEPSTVTETPSSALNPSAAPSALSPSLALAEPPTFSFNPILDALSIGSANAAEAPLAPETVATTPTSEVTAEVPPSTVAPETSPEVPTSANPASAPTTVPPLAQAVPPSTAPAVEASQPTVSTPAPTSQPAPASPAPAESPPTVTAPAPLKQQDLISILNASGQVQITQPHDVIYPTDLVIPGTEGITNVYVQNLPKALANYYTGYNFDDVFGSDVAARTAWQQAMLKQYGSAFDQLQSQSRLRLNVMTEVLGMFRGYVGVLAANNIHTPQADAVRQIYATLPAPDDLTAGKYNAMTPAQKQDLIATFDAAAQNFLLEASGETASDLPANTSEGENAQLPATSQPTVGEGTPVPESQAPAEITTTPQPTLQAGLLPRLLTSVLLPFAQPLVLPTLAVVPVIELATNVPAQSQFALPQPTLPGLSRPGVKPTSVPAPTPNQSSYRLPETIREAVYYGVEPFGYNEGLGSIVGRIIKGIIMVPWGFITGDNVVLNSPNDPSYQRLGLRAVENRLDAWSLYLDLPQRFNTFSISQYSPSISKNKNVVYYSINNFIQNFIGKGESLPEISLAEAFAGGPYLNSEVNVIEYLVTRIKTQKTDLTPTQGMVVTDVANGVMGSYTLNLGHDADGDYISYYDRWDLKGSAEGTNGLIGKPFEIYDRIYYNPITYEQEHPDISKASPADSSLTPSEMAQTDGPVVDEPILNGLAPIAQVSYDIQAPVAYVLNSPLGSLLYSWPNPVPANLPSAETENAATVPQAPQEENAVLPAESQPTVGEGIVPGESPAIASTPEDAAVLTSASPLPTFANLPTQMAVLASLLNPSAVALPAAVLPVFADAYLSQAVASPGIAHVSSTYGWSNKKGDSPTQVISGGGRLSDHPWTIANNTDPIGTTYIVTNPATGKSVVAAVNDRGPFAFDAKGHAVFENGKPVPNPTRWGDVSKSIAQAIGMGETVTTLVFTRVSDTTALGPITASAAAAASAAPAPIQAANDAFKNIIVKPAEDLLTALARLGGTLPAQSAPAAAPARQPTAVSPTPQYWIVGDSIGRGMAGQDLDTGPCGANCTAVKGAHIPQITAQLVAQVPEGSFVKIFAGTNDVGYSAKYNQDNVDALLQAAAKKHITIVAWVGPSGPPTAETTAMDKLLSTALQGKVPYLSLENAMSNKTITLANGAPLTTGSDHTHFSSAGYTAINNAVNRQIAAAQPKTTAASALQAPPVTIAAAPVIPADWAGRVAYDVPTVEYVFTSPSLSVPTLPSLAVAVNTSAPPATFAGVSESPPVPVAPNTSPEPLQPETSPVVAQTAPVPTSVQPGGDYVSVTPPDTTLGSPPPDFAKLAAMGTEAISDADKAFPKFAQTLANFRPPPAAPAAPAPVVVAKAPTAPPATRSVTTPKTVAANQPATTLAPAAQVPVQELSTNPQIAALQTKVSQVQNQLNTVGNKITAIKKAVSSLQSAHNAIGGAAASAGAAYEKGDTAGSLQQTLNAVNAGGRLVSAAQAVASASGDGSLTSSAAALRSSGADLAAQLHGAIAAYKTGGMIALAPYMGLKTSIPTLLGKAGELFASASSAGNAALSPLQSQQTSLTASLKTAQQELASAQSAAPSVVAQSTTPTPAPAPAPATPAPSVAETAGGNTAEVAQGTLAPTLPTTDETITKPMEEAAAEADDTEAAFVDEGAVAPAQTNTIVPADVQRPAPQSPPRIGFPPSIVRPRTEEEIVAESGNAPQPTPAAPGSPVITLAEEPQMETPAPPAEPTIINGLTQTPAQALTQSTPPLAVQLVRDVVDSISGFVSDVLSPPESRPSVITLAEEPQMENPTPVFDYSGSLGQNLTSGLETSPFATAVDFLAEQQALTSSSANFSPLPQAEPGATAAANYQNLYDAGANELAPMIAAARSIQARGATLSSPLPELEPFINDQLVFAQEQLPLTAQEYPRSALARELPLRQQLLSKLQQEWQLIQARGGPSYQESLVLNEYVARVIAANTYIQLRGIRSLIQWTNYPVQYLEFPPSWFDANAPVSDREFSDQITVSDLSGRDALNPRWIFPGFVDVQSTIGAWGIATMNNAMTHGVLPTGLISGVHTVDGGTYDSVQFSHHDVLHVADLSFVYKNLSSRQQSMIGPVYDAFTEIAQNVPLAARNQAELIYWLSWHEPATVGKSAIAIDAASIQQTYDSGLQRLPSSARFSDSNDLMPFLPPDVQNGSQAVKNAYWQQALNSYKTLFTQAVTDAGAAQSAAAPVAPAAAPAPAVTTPASNPAPKPNPTPIPAAPPVAITPAAPVTTPTPATPTTPPTPTPAPAAPAPTTIEQFADSMGFEYDSGAGLYYLRTNPTVIMTPKAMQDMQAARQAQPPASAPTTPTTPTPTPAPVDVVAQSAQVREHVNPTELGDTFELPSLAAPGTTPAAAPAPATTPAAVAPVQQVIGAGVIKAAYNALPGNYWWSKALINVPIVFAAGPFAPVLIAPLAGAKAVKNGAISGIKNVAVSRIKNAASGIFSAIRSVPPAATPAPAPAAPAPTPLTTAQPLTVRVVDTPPVDGVPVVLTNFDPTSNVRVSIAAPDLQSIGGTTALQNYLQGNTARVLVSPADRTALENMQATGQMPTQITVFPLPATPAAPTTPTPWQQFTAWLRGGAPAGGGGGGTGGTGGGTGAGTPPTGGGAGGGTTGGTTGSSRTWRWAKYGAIGVAGYALCNAFSIQICTAHRGGGPTTPPSGTPPTTPPTTPPKTPGGGATVPPTGGKVAGPPSGGGAHPGGGAAAPSGGAGAANQTKNSNSSGGSGGGIGGIFSALGQLLSKLFQQLQQSTQPPQTTPQIPTIPPTIPTTTNPTTPQPVVNMFAEPAAVASGTRSTLVWSSIGVSSCALFASTTPLGAVALNGSTTTQPLATTTPFSINCAVNPPWQNSSLIISNISATTTVSVH